MLKRAEMCCLAVIWCTLGSNVLRLQTLSCKGCNRWADAVVADTTRGFVCACTPLRCCQSVLSLVQLTCGLRHAVCGWLWSCHLRRVGGCNKLVACKRWCVVCGSCSDNLQHGCFTSHSVLRSGFHMVHVRLQGWPVAHCATSEVLDFNLKAAASGSSGPPEAVGLARCLLMVSA